MQPKSKVLIVDDHPANVAIAEEILEEEFAVRSVDGGEKALELLRWFRPDVILLDIMMPGIDGYEVCRRIRTHEELRYTKVMMVSAKAMVEERLAGYSAGADDYLTKPYSEAELLSKVRVYSRLKSAEEVDQLKTEVIALLAGDLGNPLLSLHGPATILASEGRVNGDVRERLGELIFQRATQLRESIRQVLTLCALRSGTRGLRLRETSLPAVVRAAIDAVSPAAAAREVTIDGALDVEASVSADPEILQQAFSDLLGGCVARSPVRKAVRVEISAQDGEGRVCISDKGRRMSGDQAQDVFRPLPRIEDEGEADDDAPPDAAWSPRIGLALAREAFLLHGGTVNVASGLLRTTFEVSLPIAV